MPTLIPIADPADPRVEAYRDVRERDLRGREDRFIAEGEVVLRILLSQSRFGVESVFLSQRRVAPLGPVLDLLPANVPVYFTASSVMDGVAGFPVHRGILAIGARRIQPQASELLRCLGPEALVLGLIGIANHDNMGGLFRNAAAFGADAILLDDTSCDPLYRKAIRVSVGASLTVPFMRAGRAGDLLGTLLDAAFEVLALTPGGAEPVELIRRPPRCALLLGAEGPGLPPELLARTRTVRIGMAANFSIPSTSRPPAALRCTDWPMSPTAPIDTPERAEIM